MSNQALSMPVMHWGRGVKNAQFWQYVTCEQLLGGTDIAILSEMSKVNSLHQNWSEFVRNGQDKNNHFNCSCPDHF